MAAEQDDFVNGLDGEPQQDASGEAADITNAQAVNFAKFAPHVWLTNCLPPLPRMSPYN